MNFDQIWNISVEDCYFSNILNVNSILKPMNHITNFIYGNNQIIINKMGGGGGPWGSKSVFKVAASPL